MSDNVSPDIVRAALLGGLEEAFEQVHGYFLDRGTSIFETLEPVTAEEASRAATPLVGTLAAQVNHLAFYLDAGITFATEGPGGEPPDWDGSWAVTTVTDEEWQALKENLRTQHGRMKALMETNPTWTVETLGGAIATIAHSAYHLGEIRQALAVIRA
jgi:hypothetical protein